jgi:hypothetical protein
VQGGPLRQITRKKQLGDNCDGYRIWPGNHMHNGGSRAWAVQKGQEAMAYNFTWDPAQWRFRAEEARTVADQMTHEEARAIIRRIAKDYDLLAKLAEEQLADQE